MCDSLELAYTYDGLAPVQAWQMIWNLLCEEQRNEGKFEIDDHSMQGQDVLDFLTRTRKMHFGIYCEACEIHLGAVGNHDISLLFADWSQPRQIVDWKRWVDDLSNAHTFISARLYDSDYEKWQNTEDPLQYEAAGRSYEHLPMKSNELPPPLERQIIDTSKNPGRRILRNGFVEAVGTVMWLGPLFFQRTGADLVRLNEITGVSVRKQSLGIVEISAGGNCFSQAFGDEGRLQCALRESLFPSSAK